MSQYQVAPRSQAENDFYWRLPGFSGGYTYKASLYDIQYTDGTSWMAYESHPMVVQAVQSDQIIAPDETMIRLVSSGKYMASSVIAKFWYVIRRTA